MVMDKIKIFIGYDVVESVAFHTLVSSIIARSTMPVEIIPVKRTMLYSIHNRQIEQKQSNEFSFTRFLVPYLCDYKGYAIFMDCDMLVLDDIAKLWELKDETKAVQVVKHEYTPKDRIKYLGAVQYPYEKKNWTSVMIFNCEKCKALTPEYVNSASGLELHQFKWLESENLIGGLPKEWNHLVSEYAPNPDAKLVHYTVGGPYFNEYEGCEYSDKWFEERAHMNFCAQRRDSEAS
jgi:hypothetical protein